MFDKPPHGTDCGDCQRQYHFGQARSEFPASSRCFWCLKYLCSAHAQQPFEVDVDACRDCKPKVRADHAMVNGQELLRGPRAQNEWRFLYGSKTFTRYRTASPGR